MIKNICTYQYATIEIFWVGCCVVHLEYARTGYTDCNDSKKGFKVARKASVAQKTVHAKTARKKLFILDTNILIHDPRALLQFEGVIIGIPVVVIEELDSFKHESTDRGRNARQAIRLLDEFRTKGSLRTGVEMENGSIMQVLFLEPEGKIIIPFEENTADNRILAIAYAWKQKGYEVRFISKDLNARIKADVLGLESEDYVKEYVSTDNFYHGWRRVNVPAIELKRETPNVLNDLESDLSPNEFVLIESQNNPHNYKIFRYLGGRKDSFKLVTPPPLPWPLQPRNPQQLMAVDLLMDDSVPFVSLFGPAGTGKTFLALLIGLYKTLILDVYEKILVSRPVIPLGRDIGYLPGTMEEKLHNWMLPIYDNIQYIMHAIEMGDHVHQVHEQEHQNVRFKRIRDQQRHQQRSHGKYHDRQHHKKRKHQGDGRGQYHPQQQHHDDRNKLSLDRLLSSGKIDLEAITYMRGRSIPYQYILIDETQNLTPHEMKTLITRVGEKSKLVIAGDPYQIDSPYLDFSSNGLVVASQRFKGEKIFGTVYLETSERGLLSQRASDLL